MNRIESDYQAFRATVVIPRDKSWDDILLVKPAEGKTYVKTTRRRVLNGGFHKKAKL